MVKKIREWSRGKVDATVRICKDMYFSHPLPLQGSIEIDFYRNAGSGKWDLAVGAEGIFGSPTVWRGVISMLSDMTGRDSLDLMQELAIDLSKVKMKVEPYFIEKPFKSSFFG